MNIKYRLVLVFIFIILISSLPLALFILGREEREKISLITGQGELNSRVLARSAMNILLMNGGDIPTSKVDAREMLSMFEPLGASGLVYADCAVLSARPGINGLILASHVNTDHLRTPPFPADRLPESELASVRVRTGIVTRTLPGITGTCYEFTALGAPQGKNPITLGRLIFSEEIILEPISRVRRLMYALMAAAVLLVGAVALVFSRFISRPIEDLISGVSRIEVGDLSQRLPVKGRDEIGRLATTFNHMLTMIDLHLNELANTNRELRRLDILKDEFLANTSHELRTPISGMMGLAESLLAGSAGPLDDAARRDLDLIVRSGRRLTGLVNDILDFSRLKNRDITLEFAAVDLHAVAELVVSTLRPVLEKKGLEARNLVPPESLFAEADVNRLQQVFMNLVGNAVKFTERGSIAITAKEDPASPGMIIVSVEDTGIGIPGEKMGVIFESFEQADGSISRVYGGTGLGLSIAKKIVELHGGTIRAESIEGRGSVFTFTLRRADQAAAPARQSLSGMNGAALPLPVFEELSAGALPAGPQRGRGARTILVVDDDAVILRVLSNYLTLAGYAVTTSLTGTGALEILEAGAVPDLIILDVMLPRVSGYDIARTIRKTHPPHLLPIIMLTARSMPADVVAGIQAGASDYLTKPVHREELLARVANLVSMKESAREHGELSLLKRDLDIAHEIQQSLILREIPSVDGASIAIRYQAMTELGGDFYDIQSPGDGTLAVLVADVSGHGISAALICSMLKVAYAFHFNETADPGALFGMINSTVCGFTSGQFITACFARVDIGKKKITYSNAGHWPIMVLHRGGEVEYALDDGIPFGWDPGARYGAREYSLRSGDRVLLYTDGIVECRNSSGAMFGTERLIGAAGPSGAAPAGESADSVMAALKDWAGTDGKSGFNDDITLAIIDIT
jgi:two-component system sensor histidine kinase ChiS